jgi:hypothetical protein
MLLKNLWENGRTGNEKIGAERSFETSSRLGRRSDGLALTQRLPPTVETLTQRAPEDSASETRSSV